MKRFSLYLSFTILSILNVKGQEVNNGLKLLELKIQSADSVILVSHEATAGEVIRDDETGKSTPPPQLFLKGKLNTEIIKERKVLNALAVQQLKELIIRPFEDSIISSVMCYFPHHSILIYKKKRISHLELCFGCHKFKTSQDLKELGYFDKRKWKELFAFFKLNDMKYELDYDWEE